MSQKHHGEAQTIIPHNHHVPVDKAIQYAAILVYEKGSMVIDVIYARMNLEDAKLLLPPTVREFRAHLLFSILVSTFREDAASEPSHTTTEVPNYRFRPPIAPDFRSR